VQLESGLNCRNMFEDIFKRIKNKNEHKSTTSLKFKEDLVSFILKNNIEGNFLEIGTNRGYTTAILAGVAKVLNKVVYSFDNNLEVLKEAKNLFQECKLDNCFLINKDIYKEPWGLNKDFGLVLIDAVHEQKAFSSDLLNTEKILLNNGFIVVHDFGLENKYGRPIYEVLHKNKNKYEIIRYIGEKSDWNPLGTGKAVDFEGVIIKILE